LAFGDTRLGGTSQDHREQLERHVHLLLLWVADCDGRLEEAELDFAAGQFHAGGKARTDALLSIIRNGEPKPIEAAIRFLAAESRELRTAFLDLAISMAMIDREFVVTENHVLRFYADALHLGENILERRFRTICGMDLSDPDGETQSEPDPEQVPEHEFDAPGSPGSRGAGEGRDHTSPRRKDTPRMTTDRARAMLGVDPGSSRAEIEQAYRKLAQLFLFQRVEAMGAAAIAVARTRSRKLRDAYNLLRGDLG
jgi:DnaJ-domain-containing protein 1